MPRVTTALNALFDGTNRPTKNIETYAEWQLVCNTPFGTILSCPVKAVVWQDSVRYLAMPLARLRYPTRYTCGSLLNSGIQRDIWADPAAPMELVVFRRTFPSSLEMPPKCVIECHTWLSLRLPSYYLVLPWTLRAVLAFPLPSHLRGDSRLLRDGPYVPPRGICAGDWLQPLPLPRP